MELIKRRPIRSFALRQGRKTAAQQHAFETYWPQYGLKVSDGVLDVAHIFGRQAPLIMDIGFGMGQTLAAMAEQHPDFDFIGVEVHTPGVGSLMAQLAEKKLTNVRLYHQDVLDVLENSITEGMLAGVQLFFSDPWPKQKHHKRRLVNLLFLDLVKFKLESDGFFYFISDWKPYVDVVGGLLVADKDLCEQRNSACYRQLFETRLITKFERKGEAVGRKPHDFFYTKPKAD